MAMDVTKADVWHAPMEDHPGAAAAKLRALADAGADLEFVIARRAEQEPAPAVIFVTPIKGTKVTRAAREQGFEKSDSMHSLRVEGASKPGVGAGLAEALAEAGVNLRGISAAVIGRKFVCYLAFDSADDATKATRVLKKL